MVSRLSSLLLIVVLLSTLLLQGTLLLPGFEHPPTAQAQSDRLVLAFYYPWFDGNTWKGGKVPDLPQTLYNSDDTGAMARQIEQAQGRRDRCLCRELVGQGQPHRKES